MLQLWDSLTTVRPRTWSCKWSLRRRLIFSLKMRTMRSGLSCTSEMCTSFSSARRSAHLCASRKEDMHGCVVHGRLVFAFMHARLKVPAVGAHSRCTHCGLNVIVMKRSPLLNSVTRDMELRYPRL